MTCYRYWKSENNWAEKEIEMSSPVQRNKYLLDESPRIVFSLLVLLSSQLGYTAEDTSNFECLFDRHYATYLEQDKTERYDKGLTRLTIIGNRTSKATLRLDGSIRATNSKTWQLLKAGNLGASYAGDYGDLLTVFYRPGDGFGEYRASLQWTALGYAFSDIGTCEGEPEGAM